MPGVPAGSAAAAANAGTAATDPVSGLAGGTGDKPAPFGGNKGRKPTGFKPGSPEALAAKRARDAARKRQERAVKAAAEAPPPLPGSTAPVALPEQSATSTPSGPVAVDAAAEAPRWCSADFNEVAPQLVELGEAWRVDAICRKCVAAKLPRKVVEEFERDASFPPTSKKALSGSLPGTLADAFNAIGVPLAMKKWIVSAPVLTYLILRDFQIHGKLDKLISSEQEREQKQAEPAKG